MVNGGGACGWLGGAGGVGEHRPLHAIHVNSYNDYVEIENPWSPESAQYKWVAADLAAVDRSKTPWVAVFLHAPWCVGHWSAEWCLATTPST